MTTVIACDLDKIRRLDAGQLQELLNRLLHVEAREHGIARSSVHVTDPARIIVPDGGEDGRIEWRVDPITLTTAPGFLLGIVPLLSKKDDGTVSWTPLVQTLVDEFGDRPETLDALSSNMGTFGWTGSMVPYYEQYVGPLRV